MNFLSSRKLAERSGLDAKTVWRLRREPGFRELVDVTPGHPRERGRAGIPTRYDLRPLMTGYREWRRLRLTTDHLAEDVMTPAEETRSRVAALCHRSSWGTLSERLRALNTITDLHVESALRARRNDPVTAARSLVDQFCPAAAPALDELVAEAA